MTPAATQAVEALRQWADARLRFGDILNNLANAEQGLLEALATLEAEAAQPHLEELPDLISVSIGWEP